MNLIIRSTSEPDMFILSLGGEDIADVIVDEDAATAMVDITGIIFREKVKNVLRKHFPDRLSKVAYYGLDYT